MTHITHIDKHRASIVIALVDGIRAARLQIDTLKNECPTNFNKQVEEWDDWIVDLLDAIHWINGEQFAEMRSIYNSDLKVVKK